MKFILLISLFTFFNFTPPIEVKNSSFENLCKHSSTPLGISQRDSPFERVSNGPECDPSLKYIQKVETFGFQIISFYSLYHFGSILPRKAQQFLHSGLSPPLV